MIKKDPRLAEYWPPLRARAWRYMTVEKFLDLLINSRLFFVNQSRLSDQFEGTVYEENIKQAKRYLRENKFSKEDIKQVDIDAVETANLRSLTLVNSWTLKHEESFGLWKAYVGMNPGVAIRTTVGDLRRSISSIEQSFPEEITMSKVIYADRLIQPFSRLHASITKKPFYAYEEELRLLIFNYQRSEGGWSVPYDIDKGKWVSVDASRLIHRVHVSPFLQADFRRTLSEAFVRLAPFLKGRIHISGISERS